MFEIDLKSQVPAYQTNQANWGGAACCQMAMNGYPQGATSCYIDQATIWNYIQAHNKEPGYSPSSWDYGWYADPYAVTKTLNDLCPPQHSWVDVSSTNKESVLYTLLRYMANYKYASLMCWWMHDSWATLVYYRTSDDPRNVNNPTLERIGYYAPGLSGVDYKEIDGPTWMSGYYYWGSPCNQTNIAGESLCGTIWNKKWVGIGEPPQDEGLVQAESISRTGQKLIQPQDAVQIAQQFVAERREVKSQFMARRLAGARAGQPMLVRELIPGLDKQLPDIRYYIVPFAVEYEVDRRGAPLTRFSVLVNAYTRRLEELCVFSQPIRYLAEREAVAIATRALRLDERRAQSVEAELVSWPRMAQVSNASPAWKIVSDQKTFLVTQDGLIASMSLHLGLRGG